MKQYNRSDHDKQGVNLSYVGLASVVERIHAENGLDWTDLINDGDLGPKERRLFKNLAAACDMTEKQRETILLYCFDHLTLCEIAAKFGISQQSVSARIKGGKLKLYPLLKSFVAAKEAVK